MKYLLLILIACGGVACSSGPMKRCDGPFLDPSVEYCPDQAEGASPLYRKECGKPVGLYQGCVKPQ